MRNKYWLRYGMASASIAALVMGGALAACGDDDSGSSSSGGVDGGNDTNTPETGTPDTSTPDATKPPPPPEPAKLLIVHAATDLGESNASDAVRVCFATAPKATPTDFQVTPFPALPHSPSNDAGTFPFPGIFPGTGGIFPSSGADLEDLVVRPYVMNAETLAARGVVGNATTVPRCNNLLREGFTPDGGFANDGGPLEKDTDYWQLADIPADTLKKEKTYMLVVTGCTQDAPIGSFCGNADNNIAFAPTGSVGAKGIGNLKLLVLEMDTSAVAADELGAQVVHASPQYQARKLAAAVPPFNPRVANAADAGGDAGVFPLTQAELEYNRNATAPTALVKVKGLITQTGYFAESGGEAIRIALNNTGIPSSPTTPPISVQAATTGDTGTTQMFVNGKSYTFVLVGDTEGTANKKVHYLGFPNVFTPPPLQ